MFRRRDVAIGPVFRCIVGGLGVLALTAGLVVAADEVRLAVASSLRAWFAAASFAIIMAGGVVLVRGAIRGRLAVRSYGRR